MGLGYDRLVGSPCADCVRLWLRDRGMDVEQSTLSAINRHRSQVLELIEENDPHIFSEIPKLGDPIRLDCAVYPHPECSCNKSNYTPPKALSKQTNFAFSPIVQLKCVRYGTPSGNLWQAIAFGRSVHCTDLLKASGVGREKETARIRAVEEWMIKAARLREQAQKEEGGFVDLVTDQTQPALWENISTCLDSTGIGNTKEKALLNGLHNLARLKTLRQFSEKNRKPMLVVGTNSWLRGRVPFYLLQAYDLYALFYPNPLPSWVVGMVAFSRVRTDEPPKFVFASASNIQAALDEALFLLLERCYPGGSISSHSDKAADKKSRLNLWWTHWIYRCPKISLRDILHLEDHPNTLDIWRHHFSDSEDKLHYKKLNDLTLPDSIRHLIKVYQPSVSLRTGSNVNGIGVVAHFRQASILPT